MNQSVTGVGDCSPTWDLTQEGTGEEQEVVGTLGITRTLQISLKSRE